MTTLNYEELLATISPDNPPEECPGKLCTGWVIVGKTWGRCPLDGDECPWADARDRQVHYNVLSKLAIGQRYHRARLENVREETARERVNDYIANIGQRIHAGAGIIAVGGVGSGKTCILAIIAFAAAQAGIDVSYWYAGDLFDALHRDARDQVNLAKQCQLLLLDDFGTQYVTEWTATRFDALTEHRYANCLATCITTNVAPEDLRASDVLNRVVDRWSEMCVGISTGSESMRSQAGDGDSAEAPDGGG